MIIPVFVLLLYSAYAFDLPLYTLPATINGVTYQHGAIQVDDNGGTVWYYNQTPGQQLYMCPCQCPLPLNPTVYPPYNRWDIFFTEATYCTFSLNSSMTDCTWDTASNSNFGIGIGAYAFINGDGGQAYSDMDWVNTDSGLCSQGTLFKSSNWNFSPSDGLVAYWSFDNCDATDDSGNGHDGTIYGNPQCVDGEKGKGYSFDGVDDYIEVPHSDQLNPTEAVTISLWARELSDSPAYSSLIYKAGGEPVGWCGDRVYSLWTRNDKGIHFTSTPEGSSNQTPCDSAGSLYSLNEFVHVVGVIDTVNHTMSAYVNGNKVSSCEYDGDQIRSGTYPLRIGGHFHYISDQFNFNGVIDEVRIYNRALTEAEIQALYRSFTLSFPLSGHSAYTANISSVLDHSGPFYNEAGHINNVIIAYTGEEARCEYGAEEYLGRGRYRHYTEGTRELQRICNNTSRTGTWGYMKEDHSEVTIPGQGNYLWYDGHPGYDYPIVTDIIAPADGILCISTNVTNRPQRGDNLWRDVNNCLYGNDPINGTNYRNRKTTTSWDGWHTFYIVHNVDNYTTWYLHSERLDPTVQNSILNNGYAEVTRGQTVARVGNYGTGGSHLHFEVRQGDRTIIDPYGWGSDPILWSDR